MLTATAVVGTAAAATATGTSVVGTVLSIICSVVGIGGTAVGTVLTIRGAVKSNSSKEEIAELSRVNKEQEKINRGLKNNIYRLKESNDSLKELIKQQERKIDELQRLNNNYGNRIEELENSSSFTAQILMQQNNIFNRNKKTYEPDESEMFSYKKTRRRSNATMKEFGTPRPEKKDFYRNCESEY